MWTADWTWRWAWNAFTRWGNLDLTAEGLTAPQRWEVVCGTIGPGLRHHYVRPSRDWLHRHMPTWILMRRLRRMGSRWYRIPSVPIALHVWHRLGIRVREHEFVRIEHGEIQAIAVFDRRTHCCEFWLVDEIGGPDPRPTEIKRAWHSYAHDRRTNGGSRPSGWQ